MKKPTIALFTILAISVTGCSFSVKTAYVPDIRNYPKVDVGYFKDEVAGLLGDPMASGVYIVDQKRMDLDLYMGIAGVATTSSLSGDVGEATVVYEDGVVMIYQYAVGNTSKPIPVKGKPIPYSGVVEKLVPGKSRNSEAESFFGEVFYRGKYVDSKKNIRYDTTTWSGSGGGNNSRKVENGIVISSDNGGTIQMLEWVSSIPEHISSIETLSDGAFMAPFSGITLNTDRVFDKTLIPVVLEKNAMSVKDVEDHLGPPNALGVKLANGEQPLAIAVWSQEKIKIGETEKGYTPPGREKSGNYMVMDMNIDRLIVYYDQTGLVKEIVWSTN